MKLFKKFKKYKDKKQFNKYYNEIIELKNQVHDIQNDLFKKVSNQFEYMIKREIVTVVIKGQTFKFRFEQEIELITKLKDIKNKIHDLVKVIKNKYDYNFIEHHWRDLYGVYLNNEVRTYSYIDDVFPRKSIDIIYVISNDMNFDNIFIEIKDISKTYLLKEDKYVNGNNVED